MNALQAISIVLLEHGGVRCEIISIASPSYLIASSCEVASHHINRAILQHVNLSRITTAFPMVWAHPKWCCPCAFAIYHLNVKIELVKIIHAERALHF